MVSLVSVQNLIEEAKGLLLVVMQEADDGGDLDLNQMEWATETFRAYELLTEADQAIGRAQL